MTTAVAENLEATATDAENVDPEADEPMDFSEFEYAVADISLATLENVGEDEASVIAARTIYNELNAKSKRAAKKWLKDTAQKLMLDDDFAEAKRLTLLNKLAARNVASKTATVSSRKSPQDKVVETFKTIHLAYQLIAHRAQALGIDLSNAQPEIDITPAVAYAEWIDNGQEGDEPEADDVLKQAARVSLGRGPKGQGRKPGSKNAEAEDNEAEAPAETDPIDAEDAALSE